MSKKKDTQLFICNYNTHVNFPHQIDKTMVDNEQVVKEFYVIKPHPGSSTFLDTELLEYEDDDEFMHESNYLDNDYLTTLYQTDSRIEDNDTTYQTECTDKYTSLNLQKDHKDCLTVDSDGISFQECILRPNQMWSVYHNEASC